MGLTQYKQKRSFEKTPEPAGGKPDSDKLRFVIQKHAASHLHYDFRLEMEGVLKSWAVPKGPSTDPEIKRLAMMVEDHPYDYRTFEGIIPEGQYGGGTVMVWDEGTYEDADLAGKTKKEQEKHLLHGLHSGKIKFIMHGKKLQGEYALVQAHGRGENGWLLMKLEDKYASKEDITLKDKSVVSKKTLEGIKKTTGNIWNSNHEETTVKPTKKTVSKKTTQPLPAPVAASESNVTDLLNNAPKERIPTGIKPMLATLVDEAFDDPQWVFEVKWDGYRALSFINKGTVDMFSRNNKSFNEKFYPIYQALQAWKINAVIDGEIVVLDKKGVSNFGQLQNWRSEADGELVYYVFDILWYDGKNLMGLPLSQRQAILKEVLPADDDRIRVSDVFTEGVEFFNATEKMGLEGMIAKKADSTYTPDARSKEWLKVKVHKRQEVVIAGFTKNEDTVKQFSSLLLGVYEDGALQYVGKVGTGFTDKVQKEMMAQFKPLITRDVPFSYVPDVNKPSRFRPNPPHAKATWLKPDLVCEVAFTEVTDDGVFRHPSFQGMRTDKKAKDVVRETEKHTADVVAEEDKSDAATPNEEKTTTKKKAAAHTDALKPPKGDGPKTLLNPKEETQVKKVDGHELKFTHLSKLYWPEDKVSKRDMFNYYYQVAEYMLPYLKDRPMSLNRFPNGIHGPSFYQKDVAGKAPEWVKKFPYTTSEGEDKEYLVGTGAESLLWMASLGCIEINPWFSRVQSPDNPDYCVIDLDPDKNTFDQVIAAALEVKKVLDALDVPSFCKTSGSTGMHIYIPMDAKYSYDQTQTFARLVVNIVHEQIPDYTSLERMVAKRNGKMYLDFLQNRPGATIAGPYSLRPKPGATVSMPLDWSEVKPGLTMRDFTIFNAIDRLRLTGDLFKGALGKGVDLDKVIEKAGTIFEK